ncbi:MAG: GyrI-like domain-containing protein [Arachnia sp.]
MKSFDIKKAHPALYAPKSCDDFHEVLVPELLFLQILGHGDPNTSPAYLEAVQSLYTLSYAIRAVAKKDLGRVHTVGPLEGLWSAEDPRVFAARKKSAWDWTMLISQPDWITPEIAEHARSTAMQKKNAPGALEHVHLAPYAEGTCVQILHVGSYDDEAPTIARLHEEYLPAHGLTFSGRHHEIYLSDPRRVEPAKLRTILRQPVTLIH